tara:strand:+ start:2124 stop:3056 length:933 start_codon:yes stop_codon:yes gene_type:complete
MASNDKYGPANSLSGLTFCIPSFGEARYLIATLESIRQQSINCHAVVCFGGTPTAQVVDYCNRYDWVDLKPFNEDPGMVACWSAAADSARTEFLTFMADDNTVCPMFAETMMEYLAEHPQVEFVFCSQNYMDSEGDICHHKTADLQASFGRNALSEGILDHGHIPKVIQNNSIPLESSVFRRKVWSDHGPFVAITYGSFDIEFIFRILLRGVKAAFLNQFLMNFRWHDNAYCTRATQEHLEGSITAYRKLEVEFSDPWDSIFKRKRELAECHNLRFPQAPLTRIKDSIRLSGRGFFISVAKQNLRRLLSR